MPLQPILTEYTKNGYLYRQIYRADLVTVWEQIMDSRIIAYEVCEVIIEPESFRFGQLFETHERLPGTKDWGTKGFTCRTIEDAFKRVEFLQERITKREQNKAVEMAVKSDRT